MKKKRLLSIFVATALLWLAWWQGVSVSLTVFSALILALGLLQAVKLLRSRIGLDKVRALSVENSYSHLIASLPDTGAGEPFTFMVIGDTRRNLRVAEQLMRHGKDASPRMVFHTGDIVRDGTPGEYSRYLAPLIDIARPIPLLCVAGNHERGPWRDFAAFKAIYGADRFAFTHGSCGFLGFNNGDRSRVSDEDMAFLEAELGAMRTPHKFVFFHIPPAFFEALFVSDSRRRGFTKRADEFHKLLVRHKVTECFMAHIHGYASEIIDGVRYTLTAGGGAPLSRRIVPHGRRHHYLIRHAIPGEVRRETVWFSDGQWETEQYPSPIGLVKGGE